MGNAVAITQQNSLVDGPGVPLYQVSAKTLPSDQDLMERLNGRFAPIHLRQRLGFESDHEASVFGQGLKFFHLENWYSVHSLIRTSLRLSLLLGRGRRNARRIELRHNVVPISGLPDAFEGLKILHLSDLHIDMYGEFPQVLAERVQAIDYDICVMTGDYRYKTFGNCEAALKGLERLRSQLKDPIYAVLGNHDSVKMVPPMEDLGIRVLLNESIAINRGEAVLHLAGIDDPHYYRTDNLERAREDIDPRNVSVLLAHSPEIYKQAAYAGFKLLLCGHTHGGQICLPGQWPIIYDAKCPRRMARGAWHYRDLQGYTSAGAGSSMVEVRINCPPEITVHCLRHS